MFESIRSKGAAGKHLAMGERSLLDAFQSAAKQMKDRGLDILIPFHSFYAPIESFLEPAVKRTIDQACEQDTLTDFDGSVLKTLFLIRYVNLVKSTLDNLVTLSIDCIDADKIELRKEIEASLNRLERQLLIARNGDEFIFLTNEEKEIEKEIQKTEVEGPEVSNKLSAVVFDGVLHRQNQYRYPANKQDFKISRFCNGHPKDGTTLEDLVIKVTSPLDVHYDRFLSDQHCINHTLEGDGCVMLRLGEDKRLWDELTVFLKTDRFLKQNAGQRPEQEHLLREKQMENIAREKRLNQDFEKLFIEADVFAIGIKLPKKSTSPIAIVDEACKYVIENTFAKLNLLQLTPGDVLRELQAVLSANDIAQAGLDLNDQECNPKATTEVAQYIALKIERNEAVYLRDVVTHFGKRPYGWPDNESLLLVARLALAGKISFTVNTNDLSLKLAYDAFISARKRGEVRIRQIRQHDERQLKKAAALMKNAFSITVTGSDEKQLYERLVKALNQWSDELKSFKSKAQTGHYPGKTEIDKGLVLVAGILEQANSFSLIERFLKDGDELKGFVEVYEDLSDFYTSQFQTWQTLGTALNSRFKMNRPALEKSEEAAKALAELDRIYAMSEPYQHLRNINGLVETVQRINDKLVADKRSHGISRVELRIDRVTKALQEAGASSELQNQALRPLQQCKQRIETTDSIAQISSEQTEAEHYEDDAFELLNQFIEEARKKAEAEKHRKENEATTSATKTNEQGKDGVTVQPGRNQPASVVPEAKRTVTINPAEAMRRTIQSGFIETEAQIDQYLSSLRDQLLSAVSAGDRVRIK